MTSPLHHPLHLFFRDNLFSVSIITMMNDNICTNTVLIMGKNNTRACTTDSYEVSHEHHKTAEPQPARNSFISATFLHFFSSKSNFSTLFSLCCPS